MSTIKIEQVPQRNLFRCQTSVFYFSTYHPDSFKHLVYLSTSLWIPSVIRPCCLLSKPLTNSWLHHRIWCKFQDIYRRYISDITSVRLHLSTAMKCEWRDYFT